MWLLYEFVIETPQTEGVTQTCHRDIRLECSHHKIWWREEVQSRAVRMELGKAGLTFQSPNLEYVKDSALSLTDTLPKFLFFLIALFRSARSN